MFKKISEKIKMSMVAILATTTLIGASTATAKTTATTESVNATTATTESKETQTPLDSLEITETATDTLEIFRYGLTVPFEGSASTKISFEPFLNSYLDTHPTDLETLSVKLYKTTSKNGKYSTLIYKLNNDYLALNVNNKTESVEILRLKSSEIKATTKKLKKLGVSATNSKVKDYGTVIYNEKGKKTVMYNNRTENKKVRTKNVSSNYLFVTL